MLQCLNWHRIEYIRKDALIVMMYKIANSFSFMMGFTLLEPHSAQKLSCDICYLVVYYYLLFIEIKLDIFKI
jgi:hypothetical protein